MSRAPEASSRSPMVSVLGVIVIVAVGLAVAVYLRRGATESHALEHPAVGTPLVALDLTPLVGAERNVRRSQLEGKVVLVNYWGTWCGPCRQEFPHMVALYDQFRSNSEFALLSISVEYEPMTELETLRRDTAAYVERMGAGFPVYADPDGENRRNFMALSGQPMVVPQTILLDQQGVVRAVWVGYAPGYEKEMSAMVAGLLGVAEPAAE